MNSLSLWARLSIAAAILGFAGSVVALSDARIYGGLTAAFLPQAIAQDLANLGIAPLLVLAAILTLRGSRRAYLVWLGVVAFTVYNYVIYVFSVPFGPLFPVWVAVLSLSLFALVGGVQGVSQKETQMRYQSRRLVEVAAWALIVVVALFGFLWLSEDVPALLSGSAPQSAHDMALPTNPVHVLDYVFFLPAAIISGVGLLRKNSFSFVTAPAFFVLLILTCAPILITPLVEDRVAADIGMITVISVLAIGLLAVVTSLVRSVRPESTMHEHDKGPRERTRSMGQ